MADIKTKQTAKSEIKVIDGAKVASARMKQVFKSTKKEVDRNEINPSEYASDKLESGAKTVVNNGVRQFDKQGRKSVEMTKENFNKTKDSLSELKDKRSAKKEKQSAKTDKQTADSNGKRKIKAAPEKAKTIKETEKSSGNKTIKTKPKKFPSNTVKNSEQASETAIKTSKQASSTSQKTVKTSAQAVQKVKNAAQTVVKATTKAVKATVTAVKSVSAAIIAGGWISVAVIIVMCFVGFIASSAYGVFFSGEDSGSGMTMQTVVHELNTEYDNKLLEIQNNTPHDVLEMNGNRAAWEEILSVYAVKVNTDPNNPQEVVTMDDGKKQILSEIFWTMNETSYRTDTKTETVITEIDDGHGNIVETATLVTRTYLYITVSHKTADEMANQYGFNQEQKDFLNDLLKDENNSLWSATIYGIGVTDDQIVSVALSQVGNVGGQPYWSWYGFSSRVEWCACFVSWCANECGYIDTGVIPKFAGCVNGAKWFKDRGQWSDSSHEPSVGTIIFFDWEGDGITDHVGIVQKCENGTVYTIEGNSDDCCRIRTYVVGSEVIYGYGIPKY